MTIIIAGKDCENCVYASIDETDKSRIRVYCDARDKQYYWGQNIQCDDKKKNELEK